MVERRLGKAKVSGSNPDVGSNSRYRQTLGSRLPRSQEHDHNDGHPNSREPEKNGKPAVGRCIRAGHEITFPFSLERDEPEKAEGLEDAHNGRHQPDDPRGK